MTPGLYDHEPEDDGTVRLHQSTASLLVNKSPLHGWHAMFAGEPKEATKAMDKGELCHALLLGSGKEIVPVVANDWRTKAAGEARKQARAEGKLAVLDHELAGATALQIKVENWLAGKGIILTGRSEVTAIWQSSLGIDCQGRLDHFIPKSGTIYDFKFCASASRKTCENKFVDLGYDIQHAAYVEAIETIFPDLAGRVKFTFIFIETNEPHAMRLMPCGGSMRRYGEVRWIRAQEIWQSCLERFGTKEPWPTYHDDGEPAEVPAWLMNQEVIQEVITQGGTL